MENINYILKEVVELDGNDVNDIIHAYDVDQLKLYYNTNFTIKMLTQILQYYGIHKSKMTKEEILQVLLFFEMDPVNKCVVDRRLRLWQNINELKAEPFFNKYILF